MMKENLLHYIWQFQQFNKRKLHTTTGKTLQIVSTGHPNRASGPDFLEGYIIIDRVKLHGQIEIHVRSSDWHNHCHHEDPAYHNVVLHVVWEDNKPVYSQGKPLPTLVLADFVDHAMLDRYHYFMKNQTVIPCAAHLPSLPQKQWESMLEQALFERVERKAETIHAHFISNKQDSEATAYQLLATGFGFKLNSDAFLTLSKQVPIKLVQNTSDLLALEALFFGQAGMLNIKGKNRYIKKLIATYHVLKKKHKLRTPLTPLYWKFFRSRPANFPTLRIAQFVQLLYQNSSIFDLLLNNSYKELHERMRIVPSTYWRSHYLLEGPPQRKVPGLGKCSIDILIINTVAPLIVAYGKVRQENFYWEQARTLLRSIPPENNWITRQWEKLGVSLKDASQSQGALGLFSSFCKPKRCLSCQIGKYILTTPSS